jgi:hypothetical protein
MKIKLSMLLFLGVMNQAFSQEGLSLHLKGVEGCYIDYYSAFVNKGAKPVTDGQHEVVISILHQGSSECYMGRTTVKSGKLVLPVELQKDDMSYVPLSTVFRDLDQGWLAQQDKETLYDVVSGMSKLFVSQEGYYVQLFFPEFINNNSGVNKKAPPASELLKGN